MPKIEELGELVNKFEDRVKLGSLINEKRFAELELKIGELNQKLNEITTDYPKLKERSGEIEDLLNIINLGLGEYKDDFEKINSSFSEFKKIPETLESVRTNLESKMRELNESVTSLTANVDVLKSLKEDIVKNSEEAVSSKVKVLEEGIERNRVEVEHVKRDLEGFSVAIRSFERTIELTNLDDIIRRFDSLDRRIINAETELEKFRGLVPNISVTIADVEILKKKFKEMGSSVMDVLIRMNEFDVNINKKISLFEDLTKKAESANEDIKTQIFKLEDTKIAVDKVYNDLNDKVSSLPVMNEDITKLKSGIEELNKTNLDLNSKLEGTKADVGKIYNYVDDKFSGITAINEEVTRLKVSVEGMKRLRSNLDEIVASIKNEIITGVKSQLPVDSEMRISKLEEQVKNVSSLNFDKMLAGIRERISDVEKQGFDRTGKLEYGALKEKVESVEKFIADTNKSLFSFQKTGQEPRKIKVETVNKGVSKNIIDEIISLKNMISTLSSENNDLKKVIRDVRLNQMDAITSDVFVGTAARVSTIEKKLSEIEEEMSKMRTNR